MNENITVNKHFNLTVYISVISSDFNACRNELSPVKTLTVVFALSLCTQTIQNLSQSALLLICQANYSAAFIPRYMYIHLAVFVSHLFIICRIVPANN